VEPVVEGDGYRFTVKVGKPKDAEATKNGTSLRVEQTSVVCCPIHRSRQLISDLRPQGRVHGHSADGNCSRGGARTALYLAYSGARSHRPKGTTDVEAGN